MNLSLVLDIVLGLIFIYLILSLLASEIQEIIGAVLQWRAEHLKLSIEVLLSGNDQEHEATARALADTLYKSPWIRSLNQEAKGKIARSFRKIFHGIGNVYRLLTGTRNVFGKGLTSGPSYISSEAFANGLMDQLQLGRVWQVIVEDRFKRFVEDKILLPVNNILNDLRASSANEFLLSAELRQLEQTSAQILQDFRDGHVKLPETLDRIISQLDEFALRSQDELPDNNPLTETFLRRLDYIRRSLASTEVERSALLKKLRPTMDELLGVFDDGSVTYQELVDLAKRHHGPAKDLLEQFKTIKITPALQSGLSVLSKNVEVTIDAAEDMVKEFSSEVASWFDSSMERASGVYKRNAKAVSIIIGIAVAVSINADSLHIATRLARDPAVRNTITQAAQQFASNADYTDASGQFKAELEAVQQAVDETLETMPLPLGYTETVIEQQIAAEQDWPIPFLPRRLLGWVVSGLAISMGASFWFDLLQKVINVRSSGGKTTNICDEKQVSSSSD